MKKENKHEYINMTAFVKKIIYGMEDYFTSTSIREIIKKSEFESVRNKYRNIHRSYICIILRRLEKQDKIYKAASNRIGSRLIVYSNTKEKIKEETKIKEEAKITFPLKSVCPKISLKNEPVLLQKRK